ncbi:MAG: tripartite tricarboxylate transporter TctB family protein [Sphaerochaetaceae bacterium]
MKKNQSIIESYLLIAFGLAVIVGSLRLDSFGELVLSPGLFPLLLGTLIVLIASLMLSRNIKLKAQEATSDEESHEAARHRWREVVLFVVVSLVYVLIMKYFHFLIATILYIFTTMWLLNERRWWSLITFPIAVSLIIYLCFDKGLNVYLP